MDYVFQIGQDVEIYLNGSYCWSMAKVIADNFPGRIYVNCKRGSQFVRELGDRIVVVDRHLVRPAGPYPLNLPIFRALDPVDVFNNFEWWEGVIVPIWDIEDNTVTVQMSAGYVTVQMRAGFRYMLKLDNLRPRRRWVPENDSWIPPFGVGDGVMYQWPPYNDDVDDDDDDDEDMLEPEDDDEEEAHGQARVDFGNLIIRPLVFRPLSSSSSSSDGGSPIPLN